MVVHYDFHSYSRGKHQVFLSILILKDSLLEGSSQPTNLESSVSGWHIREVNLVFCLYYTIPFKRKTPQCCSSDCSGSHAMMYKVLL